MIQPNSDFSASGSYASDSIEEGDSKAETRSTTAPTDDKGALIELVGRAEAGDPVAQAELMRQYSRRVAGFVRGIIRQPDAVEDVTQVVFIKMFRRLGRLREHGVFESWLFTLARNTSLDFIRRRNCRPSTVSIDDEVNQIADPSNGSATTEIMAALDRALERLNPADRTLVTQFVAGESYGSIAEQAGLTLATVKVRLHRVRPILRTWVGEMTETRQPGGKGWRRTSGSRSTAFPAAADQPAARKAA